MVGEFYRTDIIPAGKASMRTMTMFIARYILPVLLLFYDNSYGNYKRQSTAPLQSMRCSINTPEARTAANLGVERREWCSDDENYILTIGCSFRSESIEIGLSDGDGCLQIGRL